MEILKYYDSLFEAEVARGRLESEGITAIVQNENLGTVIPIMSVSQSFKPYIVVRDEDMPRAAEVLGINVKDAEGERRCPECGSEDLAFRFFYKNRPAKAFVWLLLAPLLLASMHAGNIRRAYNCRKCGNWF